MKAFECTQCGTCCFGEGGIRIQGDEAEGIARFLGTSPASFLARFSEERHGRLYIRTGADGFCAFYDKEKQCLIHPVKPAPCRRWPFYPALVNDRETWEMTKGACPGINPDCPFEEFQRQAKE